MDNCCASAHKDLSAVSILDLPAVSTIDLPAVDLVGRPDVVLVDLVPLNRVIVYLSAVDLID